LQLKNHFVGIDKSRFETFVDAILAIIMTLLVLDVKVPDLDNASDDVLKRELLKSIPSFIGFIVSFFTVVVIWIDHHDLMKSIQVVTKSFVMLNFILIAVIATLPFSTALAWRYPHTPQAVLVYAANIFLLNAWIAIVYVHPMYYKRISVEFNNSRYQKVKGVLSFSGLAMMLAALPLCFVNPVVSLVFAALVPASHMVTTLFVGRFKT